MLIDSIQILNNRRTVLFVMVGVFLFLQYELWSSHGGISTIFNLRKDITAQQTIVDELTKQNNILTADILDLKRGEQASEERARNDLGMIKPGETYYQFLK